MHNECLSNHLRQTSSHSPLAFTCYLFTLTLWQAASVLITCQLANCSLVMQTFIRGEAALEAELILLDELWVEQKNHSFSGPNGNEGTIWPPPLTSSSENCSLALQIESSRVIISASSSRSALGLQEMRPWSLCHRVIWGQHACISFFLRTYWVYSYSCGADFPGLRPSVAAPRSRRLPFPPGCPSTRQTGSWSPLWTGRWAWRPSCIAPGQGWAAAGTPSFPLAPREQQEYAAAQTPVLTNLSIWQEEFGLFPVQASTSLTKAKYMI